MKLIWPVGAWLSGVAAYATFGVDAWPFAMAIAATFGAVAVVSRGRWMAVYAVTLPAIFTLAAWHTSSSQPSLPDDATARFNDGVAMRLRGIVRDDADIRDTSQRYVVDVREIEMRGEWHDASGGVLVTTGLLPQRQAGDVLELEGALESPPTIDGFDYAEYLAQRGIGSVMAYPSVGATGHEEPHLVRSWTLRARRTLADGLAVALPEPHASLAQGVLLGERSALPADVTDDLNASNTSHLVVVSGSNIVLVASFATMLFTWLVGRRWAMVLSIAAVLAYSMLVGADPPVLRATVMGVLLVLAGLSGRRTDGLTSILLAAAVMTALEPNIVRDVSFQLSFAATAGIIWLAAPIRSRVIDVLAWIARRDEVPRWTSPLLAEPLAVTLAAVIATTPLIGLHFGRLSLVAIPANMLVVPAFPMILGASALAAIGGTLPWLHVALGTPAYLLLEYWMRVAAFFAALPGATVSFKEYAPTQAMLTYIFIGLAVVVMGSRRRARRASRLAHEGVFDWRSMRRVAVLAAPAAVLVATAGFIAWPEEPRRLEVTVLDVGQGDAILIETPSGRDILIDGGPGRAVLRALGDELPWHDRSIDLAVVTHAQADHATGLLEVFERYDVRRVMMAAEGDGLVANGLARGIDGEGAAVAFVRAGDVIDLDEGVRLEVLWPIGSTASDEANELSLVTLLSWGDVSFLLTGDIGAETEEALVAAGADLSATVLKVAHHGSASSTTPEFLEMVNPAVAVISAGQDNSFGHPAAEVVDRLARYGDVYTTPVHGAVHIETDGTRVWVSTRR